MLNNPRGIFVNTNFDLYVADRENHRIQRFPVGQYNGITMAGRGAAGTIDLHQPTGVFLDEDHYLFIVDSDNDRIIGSGPDGFRCVVGCSGTYGPASYQLGDPIYMAFDSYGNLYTTDNYNDRVQYFFLSTNSCSKSLVATRENTLIRNIMNIFSSAPLISIITELLFAKVTVYLHRRYCISQSYLHVSTVARNNRFTFA